MFDPLSTSILVSPLVLTISGLAGLALLYWHVFGPKLATIKVPEFDGKSTPYGKEFISPVEEGNAKCRNKIFKLKTSNYETIILPARYIDEIKSAPEDKFSLGMELYERQLGRYTLIGTVGRAHGFVSSVRKDLNRNLDATLPLLRAETSYAVSTTIGHCAEWKELKLHPSSLRMIALLTGRVFVGTGLSRNEEWINASIQTTVDTFTASFKLWEYHWAIRPIMACTMPEIQNIHRQNRRATRLLKPYLKQRLSDLRDPDFKRPVDMLQFFIDNLESKEASYQAAVHSAINVAAIHTTSMNITQAIFDLATYPEHIQQLRDEIEKSLAWRHGNDFANGEWNRNSLVKLRKLDSFLRESQRLNPPGVVSMSRKVQSDVVLSDGTFLPKGCITACDSWSATRDPTLWVDPEKFDGFRFEKLRAIPGNESKYQFLTTSPTNMPFGHGFHSCPGRFLVSNEVKTLLAYIILHYDVALKQGCSRPPNCFNNIMILPNTEGEVLFRSRSEV